jgi:hypothetical protein
VTEHALAERLMQRPGGVARDVEPDLVEQPHRPHRHAEGPRGGVDLLDGGSVREQPPASFR